MHVKMHVRKGKSAKTEADFLEEQQLVKLEEEEDEKKEPAPDRSREYKI